MKTYGLRACWSKPILDSDGAVLGTFAVYYHQPRRPTEEELTTIDSAAHLAGVAIQRARTEQAVRDSEARFRNLAENSPDGIFVESEDGEVLDVNDEACILHQLARRDLIGKHVLELVPEETHEQVRRNMPLLASGELTQFESASLRTDGTVVPVSIRVNKIEHEGRPALLLLAQDITKRREAEAALRQHQLQLAHVTRLSTMGEMVAGIAHEISQPLYAIANYATACVKTLESTPEETPASVLSWSRKISEAAARAGTILRRLREFAKKSQVELSPLPLNQVVIESLELVSAEGRRNMVNVEVDYADPTPVILADRVQIQQVLVNLLRNAYEAVGELPQSQRQVVVRTSAQGNAARVDVADSGPGISGEADERLFEPFYTTKREGLGLGLAISRSIVQSFDGSWYARNRQEGGALFGFEIPSPRTNGL